MLIMWLNKFYGLINLLVASLSRDILGLNCKGIKTYPGRPKWP